MPPGNFPPGQWPFQGFAAYRLGNLDHARRIFNQSAKIATEINTYVGKIFTALLSLPMAAQEAQGAQGGETMLEGIYRSQTEPDRCQLGFL